MSLSHEDVLQILALLDASDFDELRLETSDYKLHVRRSGAAPTDAGASAALPASSAPPALTASLAPTPAASAPAAAPQAPTRPAPTIPAPSASAPLVDVKTPLLGTFYRSPQPGAPPFVEIGAAVDIDTVVGIVEVMKLMTSVAAGVRGVIAEVLASDGGLVEYGEVLMRIAPHSA